MFEGFYFKPDKKNVYRMEVLQQAFPFDLIERFYNKYIGMNFLLQGRHPREKLSEVVVHQRELNKTLLYSQVNYMKF